MLDSCHGEENADLQQQMTPASITSQLPFDYNHIVNGVSGEMNWQTSFQNPAKNDDISGFSSQSQNEPTNNQSYLNAEMPQTTNGTIAEETLQVHANYGY